MLGLQDVLQEGGLTGAEESTKKSDRDKVPINRLLSRKTSDESLIITISTYLLLSSFTHRY